MKVTPVRRECLRALVLAAWLSFYYFAHALDQSFIITSNRFRNIIDSKCDINIIVKLRFNVPIILLVLCSGKHRYQRPLGDVLINLAPMYISLYILYLNKYYLPIYLYVFGIMMHCSLSCPSIGLVCSPKNNWANIKHQTAFFSVLSGNIIKKY